MNPVIEPVAKRLFNGDYRDCGQSGLEELQYIAEEAYKLDNKYTEVGNDNATTENSQLGVYQ